MKKNATKEILKIIFILSICLFIISCQNINIKYFKQFYLLTQEILLVTDTGFMKYNPTDNSYQPKMQFNAIFSDSDLEFISFTQSPLDQGGHVFCRLRTNLIIFDENVNHLQTKEIINDISNSYCIMNTYITSEGKLSLIISYINGEQYLRVVMYQININEENIPITLINNITQKIINYDTDTLQKAFPKKLSCELISKSNYSNKLLSCFVIEHSSFSIVASIFNPENLEFLYFSRNSKQLNIESNLISAISPNRKKILICYVETSYYLKCLIYNSESNEFKSIINTQIMCTRNSFYMGLNYINEKEEYIVFCLYLTSMNLLKLDTDYKPKETKDNSYKCYSLTDITYDKINNYYSSYIIYNKDDQKYYVLKTGHIENADTFFLLNISDFCTEMEFEEIYDNEEKSIPSTLLLPTPTSIISSFPKTQMPSTIINSPTSILEKIFTSIILTTIIETTSKAIVPPSTLLEKSSTSISFTTILETTNKATIPPTTILEKILTSLPLTTILETKSETTLVSTIILPQSTIISSKSSILETKPINNIYFYSEGDIMKGKLNKTKEELEESIDDLMKNIEKGKRYEITGNDYNVTITPINDINSFKSTFVNFEKCEEILRIEYNLTDEEILTILQIEIDRMNEKALTNQIEYAIFDENMTELNLSYCKHVEIKVTYEIKDETLFNKTLISYYSNLGIDIFNSNDSFFNDLCYPFSISDSDIILKDRVSELYQNYSLCDNGCEYDEIDIANMSVTCSCNVKTEINTEVAEPAFSEVVQTTFKDSNFGVLKCYKLVFNFENKLKNIGFLIFSVFVIVNLICIIIYFIFGIKKTEEFVLKEMNKNNYIAKVHNPKKKKITKIKKKFEGNLKDNIEVNSGIFLNSVNKSKELKKSITKKLNDNKKANKKNTKKKKATIKKSVKNKNPIFIFNYKYGNNYYKYYSKSKRNKNLPEKFPNKKNTYKTQIINKNKKSLKHNNVIKLNKETKWPGYFNLIQINANNSLKNKPPNSKFILDNYNYNEAVKYETRDFWRIFFIFLLSKENILNTFFFRTPLESQSIRISLFIFNYSCDFAFNALFYFNDKISDKYHYEGDSLYLFMLINNITITLFSIGVSYLLVKFLNILTNSKTNIELLFREEEQKMRKNKKYKVDTNRKKFIFNNILKLFKYMKIKIIFYIIIEFVIMLFFLYFITAFCEVYRDTQLSLLYDSFISFILSIPLELLISFLVSLLYIAAIKLKIQFLYNIALFSYRLK